MIADATCVCIEYSTPLVFMAENEKNGMNMELHKAQSSILHSLRCTRSARYTELRLPTGLETEAFRFHLNRLVRLGYVRKLEPGGYELTASGKELANSLGRGLAGIQKQPKLSVAVIASRDFDGTTKFLFQQRRRHPYWGFWSTITGPVQWCEPFESAAQREFEVQTGMTAQYNVKGFYRKTDFAAETDKPLEDKLFVVVEATKVSGEITNTWSQGLNAWMTFDEVQSQDKYFASTLELIDMTKVTSVNYRTKEERYDESAY